jgi:hypothetical protein
MLLICGTVPEPDLPVVFGKVSFTGEALLVQADGGAETELPCTQGTAALVSAACVTVSRLNGASPRVLLAGDDGRGKGSRLLYDYLIRHLPSSLQPDVLLLHYILPIMGLMKKVCDAAEKCRRKPAMIADASSMYAAKAAGLARRFDIFTPDFCEMAFLADPDATHPAYVSRYLFCTEIDDVGRLATAAHKEGNAAAVMIVKGKIDHIVVEGRITTSVSEPDLPALEAIGGTGDTISGMIGAMVDCGIPPEKAAFIAALANRSAGQYAAARPSTKIREIVAALPEVLDRHLHEWLKQ